MTEVDRSPVTFLLIRNDPPCRKCRATQAILRELEQARPGQITFRVITRDEPEAQRYGAILTPMLVVKGKVVCAGLVPVKSGLEKVLEAELGSPPSSDHTFPLHD